MEPQASGPGDRHLWALLRVHCQIMGDGFYFAKEVCDTAGFEAAAQAYEYLGLPELAGHVRLMAAVTEDDGDKLTRRYYELVRGEQVPFDALERMYAMAPDDFDPID